MGRGYVQFNNYDDLQQFYVSFSALTFNDAEGVAVQPQVEFAPRQVGQETAKTGQHGDDAEAQTSG